MILLLGIKIDIEQFCKYRTTTKGSRCLFRIESILHPSNHFPFSGYYFALNYCQNVLVFGAQGYG